MLDHTESAAISINSSSWLMLPRDGCLCEFPYCHAASECGTGVATNSFSAYISLTQARQRGKTGP